MEQVPLHVTTAAVINNTQTSAAYGNLDHISYDLSYTKSDFKNSDGELNFIGDWGTIRCAALSAKAGAGKYSIGIQKVGSSTRNNIFLSRNYAITCVSASFTVTARDLTATSSDAAGIWRTEPSSYAAPAVSGLASFDTADSVYTASTIYAGKASYNSLDPGTYPNVLSPSISFKSSSMANNYHVVAENASLTIGKTSTALTIEDASKIYDGKPVSLKLNYDSRVEVTPTVSYLDIHTNQAVTGIPTEPGTYQATAFITNSKYFKDVTSKTMTFTISKIDPVYTVNDLSKTYDGKAVSPVISSNTDDSVKYKVLYTNTDTKEVLSNAPVNAGNYSVTVVSQETAHYNAAKLTKNFTIAQEESAPAAHTETSETVNTGRGGELAEEAWILLAACLTGIGAAELKKWYQGSKILK